MTAPLLRLNRSSRALLFFTIFTSGIALSLPMRSHARSLGDISLQMSTERTEDGAGNALSQRFFRVGIAAGWSSLLGPTETQDSAIAAWPHRLAYGLSFRTERGLQDGSSLSGFGFGVFVGWFYGPFSLRADYFGLAEQKADNGITETRYRGGSGFSIQARWIQWFGNSSSDAGERRYGFGPTLSFDQMSYEKTTVGTLPETGATRKTESLTPGLSGVFEF